MEIISSVPFFHTFHAHIHVQQTQQPYVCLSAYQYFDCDSQQHRAHVNATHGCFNNDLLVVKWFVSGKINTDIEYGSRVNCKKYHQENTSQWKAKFMSLAREEALTLWWAGQSWPHWDTGQHREWPWSDWDCLQQKIRDYNNTLLPVHVSFEIN